MIRMKKFHPKHLWYILAAYGVWFAIFSGIEEVSNEKYWKVFTSLLFGLLIYYIIETKIRN